MAIVSERRDWFGARVPSVPPGRAIVYTRDDEEKSVVLNPQDYRHLSALDRVSMRSPRIGFFSAS